DAKRRERRFALAARRDAVYLRAGDDMIQISALMCASAIFFGIIGFLRGWNRELVASAGILLAMFAIFQFDGILRGTLFLIMPREQVFLLQAVTFLVVVSFVYQARDIAGVERRGQDN